MIAWMGIVCGVLGGVIGAVSWRVARLLTLRLAELTEANARLAAENAALVHLLDGITKVRHADRWGVQRSQAN